MEIKVVNKSKHELPTYQTEHSAGQDLRANIDQPITLLPMEQAVIPTGLYIALPPGYEAQIRSRSGLAAKHRVNVLNSPGTIDADYRGEIGVILVNLGIKPFVVNDGDRIAQMIVAKYERTTWQPVVELDSTDRGEGGYGHTGK